MGMWDGVLSGDADLDSLWTTIVAKSMKAVAVVLGLLTGIVIHVMTVI